MTTESNEFEEQCHRYFDGLMTDDETASFHTYLAQHPKAQQQFDRYQKALALLENATQADPADDLEERILQAIASPKDTPVNNVVPLKPSGNPLFGMGIRVAAIAFLAVMAIAFIQTLVSSPPETMATQPNIDTALEELFTLAYEDLDSPMWIDTADWSAFGI